MPTVKRTSQGTQHTQTPAAHSSRQHPAAPRVAQAALRSSTMPSAARAKITHTVTTKKPGKTQKTAKIALHLFSIPKAVRIHKIVAMLAPKDRAKFMTVCKATLHDTKAHEIIQKNKLEGLFGIYLNRPYATIRTGGGREKALQDLLNFAAAVSKNEKIKIPKVNELRGFFRLIEARNLLRMMEDINKSAPLPNLPKEFKDFTIPASFKETRAKAALLRTWIQTHTAFFAKMKDRDLSKIGLTLLPPEIGLFTSLTDLTLNANQLITLPKELGNLKALRRLYANNNRIASLPVEIRNLKVLLGLELEGNNFATLPKEIGKLSSLIVLKLSSNILKRLPKEMGKLKKLEVLQLIQNQLKDLPKEMGQLKALTSLTIGRNPLATLPRSILEMSALEIIYIGETDLTTLPIEITKLAKLRRLGISHSKITSLPDALKEMCGRIDLEIDKDITFHATASSKAPPKAKSAPKPPKEKKPSVETILRSLSVAINNKKPTKESITALMDSFEKQAGKKARSSLHGCLFDVCNRTWKEKHQKEKLKVQGFAREAFLNPKFDPKLKIAAIELFKKVQAKAKTN